MFFVAVILIAAHAAAVLSTAEATETALIELQHNGQPLVGLRLVKTASTLVLLGTDGQLHQLDHSSGPPTAERTLDGAFTPDSAVALRTKLAREFGPTMEVLATKHFLVVQPKGRGNHWPETFENLHRQFTQQMIRRGVNVRTGRFPMVAVVLPDRPALQAELTRQKVSGGNLAGVYITTSNRVYTFDGGMNEATATTIRHEAAHQSAFNSNIHSRLNHTPKWITEGLGMLFEPQAMTFTGSGSARISERINPEALRVLNGRYADGTQSVAADLTRLVRDDRMFESAAEVRDAYAIAWLMMFFLAERKPTAFAEILNHTASRPPFESYQLAERVADFEQIIGRSTDQLSVDVNIFLRSLR
jgi:hypothetical protein